MPHAVHVEVGGQGYDVIAVGDQPATVWLYRSWDPQRLDGQKVMMPVGPELAARRPRITKGVKEVPVVLPWAAGPEAVGAYLEIISRANALHEQALRAGLVALHLPLPQA